MSVQGMNVFQSLRPDRAAAWAQRAPDSIRISRHSRSVASSGAMETSLDLPTIDLPQQRRTDWACVVALITYIGVFGLALGLTYPLLSILMVEVGFSDFIFGENDSATWESAGRGGGERGVMTCESRWYR